MNNNELTKIKQRYNIVGNCDGLNHALELALKIAPIDLSVMILGENGVGKEIFPRIIHDFSSRKTKKYMAVNCGAIPEGTIDSELFGHEKGAFTGAVEKREGYFSSVNGGTLFLDEVGELPLGTQARLLRVLETGEYIPVGSSTVQKADVRIVAATNVNMEMAIKNGKFREDLFYRLNNVPIQIPPLRARGKDIISLFKKFALEMSEKYKMPRVHLNAEAQEVLMTYDWPGNVRQLKNVAENISITAEERDITAEILQSYLPLRKSAPALVPVNTNERTFESEREILYQILFDLRKDVSELKRVVHDNLLKGNTGTTVNHEDDTPIKLLHPSTPHRHDDLRSLYSEAVEVKEEENKSLSLESQGKSLIEKALEQTGGHRKLAAELLGISERTLYRKIKEYGLEA